MRLTYCAGAVVAALVLLAANPLSAQSAEKKAASAASPCTDLDFWIGDWVVKDVNGVQVSTASIKPGENHCSVTETWTAAKVGGRNFFCLLAYSNEKHSWEYLAAASAPGFRLRYSNGVVNGNEIRWDASDLPDGTISHFSYFKLPDGRLREFAQTSTDNGKTWKTVTDLSWTRSKR